MKSIGRLLVMSIGGMVINTPRVVTTRIVILYTIGGLELAIVLKYST